jgi:hypothetical protein
MVGRATIALSTISGQSLGYHLPLKRSEGTLIRASTIDLFRFGLDLYEAPNGRIHALMSFARSALIAGAGAALRCEKISAIALQAKKKN